MPPLASGGMVMNRAAQAQSNQTRILVTEPVGSGSIGKASSLIRIEQPMSGKAKKKAEKPRQDDCEGNDCEASSLSANPYADEVYCDQFPKSQQCYCETNLQAKRCKGRI